MWAGLGDCGKPLDKDWFTVTNYGMLRRHSIHIDTERYKWLTFNMNKRAYKPGPRAKCTICGYQISVPKKWLHYGPPKCPLHETAMEAIGNWEDEF